MLRALRHLRLTLASFALIVLASLVYSNCALFKISEPSVQNPTSPGAASVGDLGDALAPLADEHEIELEKVLRARNVKKDDWKRRPDQRAFFNYGPNVYFLYKLSRGEDRPNPRYENNQNSASIETFALVVVPPRKSDAVDVSDASATEAETRRAELQEQERFENAIIFESLNALTVSASKDLKSCSPKDFNAVKIDGNFTISGRHAGHDFYISANSLDYTTSKLTISKNVVLQYGSTRLGCDSLIAQYNLEDALDQLDERRKEEERKKKQEQGERDAASEERPDLQAEDYDKLSTEEAKEEVERLYNEGILGELLGKDFKITSIRLEQLNNGATEIYYNEFRAAADSTASDSESDEYISLQCGEIELNPRAYVAKRAKKSNRSGADSPADSGAAPGWTLSVRKRVDLAMIKKIDGVKQRTLTASCDALRVDLSDPRVVKLLEMGGEVGEQASKKLTGSLGALEFSGLIAEQSPDSLRSAEPRQLKVGFYKDNRLVQTLSASRIAFNLLGDRLQINSSASPISAILSSAKQTEDVDSETSFSFDALIALFDRKTGELSKLALQPKGSLKTSSWNKDSSGVRNDQADSTINVSWEGGLVLEPASSDDLSENGLNEIATTNDVFKASAGALRQFGEESVGTLAADGAVFFLRVPRLSSAKAPRGNGAETTKVGNVAKFDKIVERLKNVELARPIVGQLSKPRFTGVDGKLVASVDDRVIVAFREELVKRADAARNTNVGEKKSKSSNARNLFDKIADPIKARARVAFVDCVLELEDGEREPKARFGRVASLRLGGSVDVGPQDETKRGEARSLVADQIKITDPTENSMRIDLWGAGAGSPAMVSGYGLDLRGSHILVDRGANMFKVEGEGRIDARIAQASDARNVDANDQSPLDARFLADGPVSISWTKELAFAGNALTFSSNRDEYVELRQIDEAKRGVGYNEERDDKLRLMTPRLSIILRRPLDIFNLDVAREQKTRERPEFDVDYIECQGDLGNKTTLVGSLNDKTGARAGRFVARLNGLFRYYVATGVFSEDGGGEVDAIAPNRSGNAEILGAISNGAEQKDASDFENMRAFVSYKSSLNGEFHRDASFKATLKGRVATAFQATNKKVDSFDWNDPIEKDALSDEPAFAESETLTVEKVELQKGDDRGAPDGAAEKSVVTIDANDNVSFRMGRAQAFGAAMRFDSQKGTVILDGGASDATIYNRGATPGAEGEEFSFKHGVFNLKTKSFDASGVVFNY